MSYTLTQHLAYNAWANGKIADFIAKAGEKLFDAEVKSSFPSLRKTVFHIWDAEYIWYKRLNGESLTEGPGKHFNGTMQEGLAAFVKFSKELEAFIASKDQAYYASVCNYKNIKGDPFSSTVETIIMHVVNHSAFHRGQIVTMLRELGYTDLASTDLITYSRLATQTS
jgi:uncharacterized damage-inducible protein DinB